MEEVQARCESPSSKNVTSSRHSNLPNQEAFLESDSKESSTKKRSSSSKRKSRNNEKENGALNPGTNGDVHKIEDKTLPQNGENLDLKEVNTANSSGADHEKEHHQNDVTQESPEQKPTESDSNHTAQADEDKSVNGNAEVDVSIGSEELSSKEVANDSMNIDTEESFITAETESIPADKQECKDKDTSPKEVINSEDNGNLDSESDREKENGFEGFVDEDFKIPKQTTEQSEKTEPSKGFFSKWSFALIPEKKQPETNGNSDDISTNQLYFSSIRGRMPLSRASPGVTVGENSKSSVIFRKGMKTPTSVRTLDDSFGVKSEPSRINRGESKEKPNLRKFPAKRCLASDESDDKEDSFLTSLPFTKRRKLEDEKTRTGFLRSFLWSPFRKRSISDNEEVKIEESEDRAAVEEVKPSWFRSPFWFWKRCNNEERN